MEKERDGRMRRSTTSPPCRFALKIHSEQRKTVTTWSTKQTETHVIVDLSFNKPLFNYSIFYTILTLFWEGYLIGGTLLKEPRLRLSFSFTRSARVTNREKGQSYRAGRSLITAPPCYCLVGVEPPGIATPLQPLGEVAHFAPCSLLQSANPGLELIIVELLL